MEVCLRMRDKPPALAHEREISRLAAAQHGLITHRQLLALGFSRQAITRRVAGGRLHKVHRGVYAAGHPLLSAAASRLAAVLACPSGALASHTTAAAAWGLRPESGRVRHVVTEGSGRRRPGIHLHHAADLAPADGALVDRVPVTEPARTLADLGDVVGADHVRSAFVRAELNRLLDMAAIEDVLARASRRRGPATLREVLRGYDPRWQATRSELELRLLDLVAAHGLPEPEVNPWLHGRYMVDFLWRSKRVVAETDGARHHTGPISRRSDARRDRALARLGYTVVRLTYREVSSEGARVARAIREALGPH